MTVAAVSRFTEFTRAQWAALRAATPLPVTESQLRGLVGVNEWMSLDEVADIYLPVSRLLNLYVGATQSLHRATATFVGPESRACRMIGLAGSVAVGKSTTSRVLQALLELAEPSAGRSRDDRWLSAPQRELEGAGSRSGRLSRKLRPAAAGAVHGGRQVGGRRGVGAGLLAPGMTSCPASGRWCGAPTSSSSKGSTCCRPEAGGLASRCPASCRTSSIFSITYRCRGRGHRAGYVERFLKLRDTVFRDPSSYFHRYAALSPEEAAATAREIWASINAVNLRENVGRRASASAPDFRQAVMTPAADQAGKDVGRVGRVGGAGELSPLRSLSPPAHSRTAGVRGTRALEGVREQRLGGLGRALEKRGWLLRVRAAEREQLLGLRQRFDPSAMSPMPSRVASFTIAPPMAQPVGRPHARDERSIELERVHR